MAQTEDLSEFSNADLIRTYYKLSSKPDSAEFENVRSLLCRRFGLNSQSPSELEKLPSLFAAVLADEEKIERKTKQNQETGRTLEIFSYFVLIPAIGFMLISTGPSAGLTELFGAGCLVLFFLLQFSQSLFSGRIVVKETVLSTNKNKSYFRAYQALCLTAAAALLILLRKWITQYLSKNI